MELLHYLKQVNDFYTFEKYCFVKILQIFLLIDSHLLSTNTVVNAKSIADIPDGVTIFPYFDEMVEHSCSYSIDDERLYSYLFFSILVKDNDIRYIIILGICLSRI